MHIVGNASDRALLRQGDSLLEKDRMEEARQCYAGCLDYVSYLPEAKFRLAICDLRSGNAHSAYNRLVNLITTTMIEYGAADPDPVEWAYFLLVLVCNGRLERARRLQNFYPCLSHDELRRARLILDQPGCNGNRAAFGRQGKDRRSIHQMPRRSDSEWFAWFADTLGRCRQPDLANTILAAVETGERIAPPNVEPDSGWLLGFYSTVDRLMIKLGLNDLRPNVPPLPEFRYLWHLARRLAPRRRKELLKKIGIALFRQT
jgi:hypothetical protein